MNYSCWVTCSALLAVCPLVIGTTLFSVYFVLVPACCYATKEKHEWEPRLFGMEVWKTCIPTAWQAGLEREREVLHLLSTGKAEIKHIQRRCSRSCLEAGLIMAWLRFAGCVALRNWRFESSRPFWAIIKSFYETCSFKSDIRFHLCLFLCSAN